MIFGILSLAIFGGLIYGVIRLLGGGRNRAGGEESAVVLRRFLVYAALFVSIVIAAIGSSTILTEAFGGERFGDTGTSVARGLSFILVAFPAAFLLLRFVRGRLDDDPKERRSAAWAAYVNATLATSLVVSMVSAVLAVRSALDVWDGRPVATLVVWGAVWAYHWFVLLDNYGTPGRVHLAFGSAAGLLTLAGGLGTALALPLDRAYQAVYDDRIVANSLADDEAVAITVAVVGGLVWWWHWLARYLHDGRDALWHTYVIVPGVLAGTLAAVGALVWTLGATLIFLLGDPSPPDAAGYFRFLPPTLVVLLVGGLVWWYHRGVLRSEGVPERTEPVRVYDYVMAAVGLVAAAAGSSALIVALISALTEGSVAAGSESSVNPLIVGITLLVAGLPLWWGFWRRIEAIAARDATEPASETRRVYLFAVFGVGGLTAFISLITLLYGLLEPIFNGDFGASSIREVRFAIALVLTVGALAWFHFTVWRNDRAVLEIAAPPEARVDVVLVTSQDDLGDALRARLNGKVEVWHRVHDGGRTVDADELADMIRAAHQRHVLVVTGEESALVVPFEG